YATQSTKSIRGWVAQQTPEKQKSFTAAAQVDPAEILHFLLQKVQERHGEKYGEFLADHGSAQIEKWMWENIRPDVLDICKNGRFGLGEYVLDSCGALRGSWVN